MQDPDIRILMVEDNLAVRDTVAEALEEAGLAVTAATGAEAAAALMDQQPFDVLVTDIHLDTGLAGLDVARLWRARNPDRPVVFATAYPRAAVNVGPLGPRDGYLMKPYVPSELLHLIRFVLR